MPTNEKVLIGVLWVGCILCGMFADDLRNDVDVPLTDEEKSHPPKLKLWERLCWIGFAGSCGTWFLTKLFSG